MSAYSAQVLANPYIVLYWKLDDLGGTTVTDYGPGGHNGSYINAPTLGVAPLADGTSVTFAAASSQNAELIPGGGAGTIAGIQANGKMTVEFWLKTTQAPGGNRPWLVSSDTSSAGGRFFQVRLAGAGVIQYALFDVGATGHVLNSVAVVNDGAAHYVACTYDGADMKIYIDGALDSTVADAFTLANQNHGFTVAEQWQGFYPGEYFNGTMDEVALYTGPLSATDVANHFNPPTLHSLNAAGSF